jgi:hypothetical protein
VNPRRWDFISENRAAFGGKRICRVLGVSRSGCHQHRATADARAERPVEEERTVLPSATSRQPNTNSN